MDNKIRHWSRDVIADFITLYKSFPCLWKTNSVTYKSRCLRDAAYNKMIDYCKKQGFPDANRDFVVKKIQSLRGSFRKELKKQEQKIHKSGDLYVPSLWYFDLLSFTKGEDPIDGDSDTTNQNSTNADEVYEIDDEEGSDLDYNEDVLQNNENDDECDTLAEVYVKNTPSRPKKRKANNLNVSQAAELINVCTETLKAHNKPKTEYEITGMNIAKKLEKMNELQAIYAENLINSVLGKGLLNQLHADTNICGGKCKFMNATPVHFISDIALQQYNQDGILQTSLQDLPSTQQRLTQDASLNEHTIPELTRRLKQEMNTT